MIETFVFGLAIGCILGPFLWIGLSLYFDR